MQAAVETRSFAWYPQARGSSSGSMAQRETLHLSSLSYPLLQVEAGRLFALFDLVRHHYSCCSYTIDYRCDPAAWSARCAFEIYRELRNVAGLVWCTFSLGWKDVCMGTALLAGNNIETEEGLTGLFLVARAYA